MNKILVYFIQRRKKYIYIIYIQRKKIFALKSNDYLKKYLYSLNLGKYVLSLHKFINDLEI